MDRDRLHEFFKKLEYDPLTYENSSVMQPYVYSAEQVNAYYDRHLQLGNIHFVIMLDHIVIGDIYLKNIDWNNHTSEIGIHMVNDHYKGNGYGTKAMEQILKYVFEEMKMETVYAQTLRKNDRSHRLLIKAGFTMIEGNENMIQYVCHSKDPDAPVISK